MTPWSGQFDSAVSYFSVSYSPLEAGQAFPHQHGRGIGRKHILLSSVSNVTSYFLPIKCQNISSEVSRSQAKSEQMSLCWAVGPGSTGGDEEWVSVPMMLHILPSQILLQRSQTHLQPFPVRSNSLKQETCEEKSPTPICRYQNRFALGVFVSITIVGVIMRQSCFVSNTEDSCSVTPVTAIITEAVSQPNLAHSSRVWEEVGTRAGVWQRTWESNAPFYTLSKGCTSQALCVAGKAAVTGAGCQCLTRVVQGENWMVSRNWDA